MTIPYLMFYKRGKPYIDSINRTITKTTVLYLVFQKGVTIYGPNQQDYKVR